MRKIQMDNLNEVNGGFSLSGLFRKRNSTQKSCNSDNVTREDMLNTVEHTINMRERAKTLYGIASNAQSREEIQEFISDCDSTLARCYEDLRNMNY